MERERPPKKEDREQHAKKKNIGSAIAASALLFALAIFLTLMLGRSLERRTYLLSYPDEIKKSTDEYNLDPYLVSAVIHCESGNRPGVASKAGAMGLMQIMPDTGEWIAGKLKIEYKEEMLTEPGTNIRFGCWYLRFLLDRYEQNLDNALAAYNAGHGNVDKWLADSEVTNDGVLTNIPFKETAEYGKKVQRAYDKYKTLYPNAF